MQKVSNFFPLVFIWVVVKKNYCFTAVFTVIHICSDSGHLLLLCLHFLGEKNFIHFLLLAIGQRFFPPSLGILLFYKNDLLHLMVSFINIFSHIPNKNSIQFAVIKLAKVEHFKPSINIAYIMIWTNERKELYYLFTNCAKNWPKKVETIFTRVWYHDHFLMYSRPEMCAHAYEMEISFISRSQDVHCAYVWE